jgi:hypothetical protein
MNTPKAAENVELRRRVAHLEGQVLKFFGNTTRSFIKRRSFVAVTQISLLRGARF